MTTVGNFFLAAYLGTLSLMLAYQYVLGAWGVRVFQGGRRSDKTRFAILVPAHNEAANVHRLIDSLRALNYPRARLCYLFVADHCSDNTADIIAAAGFDVLRRASGPRGKAAALADGLAWLNTNRGDAFDAVVFFDADNIVDPLFLQFIAGRLETGAPIVQGRVEVHNRYASLFALLNFINLTVIARMKELARSQAGLSCHLRGHGMAFRKDVLARVSWATDSMAEDKAMDVKLVVAGERVVWENYAIVESVLPESAKAATAQRRRWAGEKSAIVARSAKALFKRWRETREFRALDMAIDFLMPSHAVQLSLVGAALPFALLLTGVFGWATLWVVALLALYLLYFFIGSTASGIPVRAFFSFLLAPFYILWRTWIYLTSLRGAGKWR